MGRDSLKWNECPTVEVQFFIDILLFFVLKFFEIILIEKNVKH